jgi:hypothetical protein
MVRPVGRLLLLAFLAAILASPRAGAQYFPSPPSLAMPQGQAFINPLTAPDGGPRVPVSPARFRVWVGAVYQHRPGEADEASRPIRSWSTADLAGILITLDGVQLAPILFT